MPKIFFNPFDYESKVRNLKSNGYVKIDSEFANGVTTITMQCKKDGSVYFGNKVLLTFNSIEYLHD